MTNIMLPAILNETPTRKMIRTMPGIRMVDVAYKIARNIHMRCRLAESQNWRCCWCGIKCVPEPNQKNSATIEHVTPRSLGGDNKWENYAMACADCNHRRGTISVEDMLAGRFPKPERKETRSSCERAKKIKRYIKKGHQLNEKGWWKEDGTPLCKKEWIESLRVSPKHKEHIAKMVFVD